ncbi:uncharacterized protein Tco025E_02605 [Trypanosoma conorhini]|uniref:Uncharacterized protein n=1 Tax=Trypanosoma conorhini TaxID=83891 RepID=A0A3R7LBW5_9TRYP|nr:uncharacterized protein Tco025E_02605 [Trypanosoma conorhini]RNF24105.1 hypothetical protein Tco025E_02605 [Trypanosoma conorhini]
MRLCIGPDDLHADRVHGCLALPPLGSLPCAASKLHLTPEEASRLSTAAPASTGRGSPPRRRSAVTWHGRPHGNTRLVNAAISVPTIIPQRNRRQLLPATRGRDAGAATWRCTLSVTAP